jgi:hypothetical protein
MVCGLPSFTGFGAIKGLLLLNTGPGGGKNAEFINSFASGFGSGGGNGKSSKSIEIAESPNILESSIIFESSLFGDDLEESMLEFWEDESWMFVFGIEFESEFAGEFLELEIELDRELEINGFCEADFKDDFRDLTELFFELSPESKFSNFSNLDLMEE